MTTAGCPLLLDVPRVQKDARPQPFSFLSLFPLPVVLRGCRAEAGGGENRRPLANQDVSLAFWLLQRLLRYRL